MDETVDTVVYERDTAHSLKLQFTGSGSEYFRIWIVNLLLTIVTLGIYFPWAKVRKLRYFYGNTLVGGEPLGFHGEPKKMLKGYALVAVFFACYSAARSFSPSAGLVALLLAALLWPALMKASLQFRLANTSWRGLRFHFTGNLRDAYRALLPLLIPGALLMGLAAMQPDEEVATVWENIARLMPTVAFLLLGPLLFWRLKKYQHDHYALGAKQTDFQTGAGSFYKLGAKIFGGYVLCIAAVMAVVALWAFNTRKQFVDHDPGATSVLMSVLFIWLAAILMIAVYIYAVARIQDLVWNHTASANVRFSSALRFKSLFWLNLKNWFFMLFTLGLYWPFAAIATQRLRVEAVAIDMTLAPEQLVADAQAHADDAAGVAAGDFFGFDIGL